MDLKHIQNNIDMLQGNINRMCVTDDRVELDKMLTVAISRLEYIHNENRKRIYVRDNTTCANCNCTPK